MRHSKFCFWYLIFGIQDVLYIYGIPGLGLATCGSESYVASGRFDSPAGDKGLN